MLLKANEKVMYEKMDRRERCRKMFAVSMVTAVISLLLWGFAVLNAAGIYYALLSGIVACVSFFEYRRLMALIMPLSACRICLTEEYISVYQIKGSGKYESCRIYFGEVKKVVAGKRYGTPEFYIILQEKCQLSSIHDPDVSGRTIFLVKGEDYEKKEYMHMFRSLCMGLPDTAELVNPENVSRWKKEKIVFYDIFLYIVPAFCLLPVIFRILLF